MARRDTVRKFEFLREIASGGFGSVFLTKVMHPDGFSRIAAVKLLHRRWSENEEIARRMRDEARLLGWLRHRNIVDVVDLTSLDGRAAIIMEYLEAADLKAISLQLGQTPNAVPPRAALEIVAAVASALDAAYNRPPFPGEKPLRVIHRDIKPSNIMIDDSGLVKVLDFGVARAEFDARESDTRELQFGSIDYMPPERLLFEPESPGSDVYSLGATLFEVLSNEKLGKARGSPEKHGLFLADRMSFLRAASGMTGSVVTELESLITSCLAYEANTRPSAADLVKQCRELAKEVGGTNLQDWAESHVMDVVRSTVDGSDRFNPLTGRVLAEDQTSTVEDDSTPDLEQDEGTVQMVQDGVKTLPEMEAVAPDEADGAAAGPPTLEELPSLDSLAFANEPSKANESWEEEPTRLEDPAKLRERMKDEEDAEITERGDDLMEGDDDEEPSTTLPEKESAKPVPRVRSGGLDASLPLAVPGTSPSLADGVVDGATLLMDESDAGGDVATMMMSEEELAESPMGALADAPEGALADAPTKHMPDDMIMDSPPAGGDEATWLLQNQDAADGAPPPPGPPIDLGVPSAEPPALAGGPANAPPLPDVGSPLGSETVFTSIGGGATGPLDHTDTTVVQRVAASLLVFVLAAVFALGTGAVLFREEIAGLFSGNKPPIDQPEPPPDQPAPPPEEPVVEVAPAPDPLEGFDGSTVAFESLLDGTERLVVRCGGGINAEGVKSVVLSETTVSRCVVTAYPAEGRQLTVPIIGDISAGLTKCFEGGKKSCGS